MGCRRPVSSPRVEGTCEHLDHTITHHTSTVLIYKDQAAICSLELLEDLVERHGRSLGVGLGTGGMVGFCRAEDRLASQLDESTES